MKRIILSIIFMLCGCTNTLTTDPSISNKFIGAWNWKPMKGSACPETHEYLSNGRLVIHSGEEVLEKSYFITGLGGGFFKVDTKNLQSNGKKDCFGNLSQLNTSTSFFVWFNNSGSLFTCATADGMACYGSANKVKNN